jgi:hypothetical protein
MAAHGIVATHGIILHGTTPNKNARAIWVFDKKVPKLFAHNFVLYE